MSFTKPLVNFSYICISEGSVATQLRCGAIFNSHVIANIPQCASEQNWLTFGEDWTKVWRNVIYGSQCSFSAVWFQ